MAVQCPQCAVDNNPGARFCKACGTPLAAPAGEERRCPNGHKMEADWKTCAWCGAAPGAAGGEQPAAGGEQPVRRKTVQENQEGKPPLQGTKKETRPEEPPPPAPRRGHTVVIPPPGKEAAPGDNGKRLVGWLVSYGQDPLGKAWELREGRHVIGASPADTIVITGDSAISQGHATLLYRRGQFLFEDNLSTNGSFVNGQEVLDKQPLHHGDVITLGATELLLTVVPGAASDA